MKMPICNRLFKDCTCKYRFARHSRVSVLSHPHIFPDPFWPMAFTCNRTDLEGRAFGHRTELSFLPSCLTHIGFTALFLLEPLFCLLEFFIYAYTFYEFVYAYVCINIKFIQMHFITYTLFLYSVFPHQHPNSDPAFPTWPMLIFQSVFFHVFPHTHVNNFTHKHTLTGVWGEVYALLPLVYSVICCPNPFNGSVMTHGMKVPLLPDHFHTDRYSLSFNSWPLHTK